MFRQNPAYDFLWQRYKEGKINRYKKFFPLNSEMERLQRKTRGPVYTGDHTPIYMYCPKAIQIIKQYAPDAKMIVLLRNPINCQSWNLGLPLAEKSCKKIRKSKRWMPCHHSDNKRPMYEKKRLRYQSFLRFNFLFLSIIVGSVITVYGQAGPPGRFTINGFVKDSLSGEDLIGSTVQIRELQSGITTNAYGFYSISAPAGTYTLAVSFIGYQTKIEQIKLDGDITMHVQLAPITTTLREVEVTAPETSDVDLHDTRMGFHKLSMSNLSKIPALGGEVDLLRALQFLPGVKNAGEASTNFSVRGGNLDHNLILLDEATVYNPSHFLGLFSVFNFDAIKDMQLYKGSMAPEYGGRLSSVLDIRMKDGNSKKFAASGGIGTVSSRLTLEGPLQKNGKTSFIASGRYTYSDIITQTIKSLREQKVRFFFYDLNVKVNHTFNDRNRLFLSGYFGEDVNKLSKLSDVRWNNATATARWNHVFNDKLFSNVTLLFSKYAYDISAGQFTTLRWNSGIEDKSLKADFSYYANDRNFIKFGLSTTLHNINPGKSSSASDQIVNVNVPLTRSLEHALYWGNEHTLTEKLLVSYGARYSLFQNIGDVSYRYDEQHKVKDSISYQSGDIYNTYSGFEPRVSIRYTLSEKASVKASYNRNFQYLQLLSNSPFGLTSFDIWFSSSPNLKPQKSDHYSIGYFGNATGKKYEYSVELYYKKLYNQVDFADHARLLFNPYIEGELRIGEGYAYGTEFFVKKNSGRLTGWISYAYARTFKKIPEINSGNRYAAGYDQPNAISIVSNLQVNERWNLAANWVYATGRPYTLPRESYDYNGFQVPVYGERNSLRLPDYHRMDLSATIRSKMKSGRKYSGEWMFSIYNIYMRKNPLLIAIAPPVGDSKSTEKVVAQRVALLGMIPSVTYNFKF